MAAGLTPGSLTGYEDEEDQDKGIEDKVDDQLAS